MKKSQTSPTVRQCAARAPLRGFLQWVTLVLAVIANPVWAGKYVGLVYAKHDLNLSIGIAGPVAEISTERGRYVQAGQVLLVLDDRLQATEVMRRKVVFEDKSELTAAQERFRVAKSLLDDARDVFEQTRSISREELSRLEADYISAKGRMEQLEAQENREQMELLNAEQERELRRLRAPVSGVISRIDAKVGEWVKPGEQVIQLVDASTCFLNLAVPLETALKLKSGMSIPIQFDASTGVAPVNGTLEFIAPVADPASGLVALRVRFRNDKTRVVPGIKGVVELPPAAARL